MCFHWTSGLVGCGEQGRCCILHFNMTGRKGLTGTYNVWARRWSDDWRWRVVAFRNRCLAHLSTSTTHILSRHGVKQPMWDCEVPVKLIMEVIHSNFVKNPDLISSLRAAVYLKICQTEEYTSMAITGLSSWFEVTFFLFNKVITDHTNQASVCALTT